MDADAVRFLKIFTFLSLDEIEDIRKQFEAAPHERLAQKILAREVVTLVHGEEAYKEALNITEQLFAGNIKNLSVKELKQGLRGVPNYQVQADENHNIVEILVSSGVVNSKRQAREDVQNGAIYVNGDRIQDLDYVLSDADKLENELTVIRRALDTPGRRPSLPVQQAQEAGHHNDEADVQVAVDQPVSLVVRHEVGDRVLALEQVGDHDPQQARDQQGHHGRRVPAGAAHVLDLPGRAGHPVGRRP